MHMAFFSLCPVVYRQGFFHNLLLNTIYFNGLFPKDRSAIIILRLKSPDPNNGMPYNFPNLFPMKMTLQCSFHRELCISVSVFYRRPQELLRYGSSDTGT